MKKFIALLLAYVLTNGAAASDPRIIEIKSAQKTDSSIKINGKANLLPEGTEIKAEVISINGRKLTDEIIIATTNGFTTDKNGTFEAHLKKYGSLGGYDFPSGKYKIQFYSSFNRAWQSVEVAKALGVKLDDQGRSDAGEPHALPKSVDLVKGPLGVRMLKTQRTVVIQEIETKFSHYKSKRATLAVLKNGSIEKPHAAIRGNNSLANKSAKRLSQGNAGNPISIICHGDFTGLGYIATDLHYSNGTQNKVFNVNNGTALIELCYQYEDSLSRRK